MTHLNALVDSTSGKIRGVYQHPLEFSISGHYVINMPDSMGVGFLTTDVVGDLIAQKLQSFKSAYPTLLNAVYDEFIDGTVVDAANSSLVYTGVNKRSVILPGGTLLTNPLSIATVTSNVWLHWWGFQLYRHPGDPTDPVVAAAPPPSKMLFEYEPGLGYVVFDPTAFTVSVCQPTSPFAVVISPSFEVLTAASLPSSVRLKFVNNTTRPMHMADFYLLYG